MYPSFKHYHPVQSWIYSVRFEPVPNQIFELQNSSKSTTDTQLRRLWFAVQCVQEGARPEQLLLTGHSTFRCISAFSGLLHSWSGAMSRFQQPMYVAHQNTHFSNCTVSVCPALDIRYEYRASYDGITPATMPDWCMYCRGNGRQDMREMSMAAIGEPCHDYDRRLKRVFSTAFFLFTGPSVPRYVRASAQSARPVQ